MKNKHRHRHHLYCRRHRRRHDHHHHRWKQLGRHVQPAGDNVFSMLVSGESRYIKAISNNNSLVKSAIINSVVVVKKNISADVHHARDHSLGNIATAIITATLLIVIITTTTAAAAAAGVAAAAAEEEEEEEDYDDEEEEEITTKITCCTKPTANLRRESTRKEGAMPMDMPSTSSPTCDHTNTLFRPYLTHS